MTGWDGFAKYIGIQGVLAVILLCGLVYLVVTGNTVPDAYYGIMGAVIGFYFAKNGVGILDIVTKKNCQKG